MAFRWWADDSPLIVVLGSNKRKKNVVKVGPPLTKLSGTAHVGPLKIFFKIADDKSIQNYPIHMYLEKRGSIACAIFNVIPASIA